MKPDLVVLSLGGGIQSSALALLAEDGRFDYRPDVALFADTGNEPGYVYETIAAISERVSYPVEVVSRGRNIAEDVYNGTQANGIPGFVSIPVRRKGKGFSVRQCTQQYKLLPINQAIREHLGYDKGQRVKAGTEVIQWLGISLDETIRMKDNRLPYITNTFPLVEARMSRRDCRNYLAEHHRDIPVGKSACVICPYHSPAGWVKLAEEEPDDFAYAVKVDYQLRRHPELQKAGEVFLHRYAVPLDEAVAMTINTPSLFSEQDEDLEAEECSGGCFL